MYIYTYSSTTKASHDVAQPYHPHVYIEIPKNPHQFPTYINAYSPTFMHHKSIILGISSISKSKKCMHLVTTKPS